MTYKANGNIYITKSPETETEFVLDFERFVESLGREYKMQDFKNRPNETLYDACIRTYGLDHAYTLEKDGRSEFEYRFSDGWADHFEVLFLKYCASVGMGIDASFTGEDEAMWGYAADFGSKEFRNLYFETVESGLHEKNTKKAQVLSQINDLTKDSELNAGEFRDKIQTLLLPLYPITTQVEVSP